MPSLQLSNNTQVFQVSKENIHNTVIESSEDLITVVSPNIKFDEKTKNLNVSLESNRKISTANIYKALCKMIITSINSEELKYVKNTISWINSTDEKHYTFPKVASVMLYELFVENPTITIYIRKNDDIKLPHIVGEFSFKCLKYVFILPFSKKDKLTFTKSEDYQCFWNSFKYYNHINMWSYYDMNSTIPTKFITNIKCQSKE